MGCVLDVGSWVWFFRLVLGYRFVSVHGFLGCIYAALLLVGRRVDIASGQRKGTEWPRLDGEQ